MRHADDRYFPMDDDFSAIYDAAMEGRIAIDQELRAHTKGSNCYNWTSLIIDGHVWYKARVTEWGCKIPREVDLHTDSNRDTTPDEIRAITAQALEQLRKCTVEGRIAELQAEIEALRKEA